ncbi:MAG TPA: hypothetical protein VI248_25720 [Kineosporiaceae bacterium]
MTAVLDQLPAGGRLPLLTCLCAFAGWGVLYLLGLVATRPLPVRPGRRTQDLPGEEPPAVVSVLASGWSVTEDAGESTLLDLAARGYLELRQPDADPRHTTVHVTADDPAAAAAAAARQARVARSAGSAAPLTPYERQVLDRVKGVAVGGVVPLTALTFRDHDHAEGWAASFAAAVLADARERGLVQRRVPSWLVALLSSAAVGPALAASWLAWALDPQDGRGVLIGIVPFGLLTAVAGRDHGVRGTASGREVAARWLGLREYLKADTSFAALPPSAVAVWDRYLAYGDALGVTHVCSAVIDLGMGNRRRVWSSFGGQWHQVRVRYPGRSARYGTTLPPLVLVGLGQLVLAYLLLRLQGMVRLRDLTGSPAAALFPLVGLAVGARGVYKLVRSVSDVVGTRHLTGEVLWIAPWKTSTRNDHTVVTLHYLAVDDGTADRTTAWALPPDLLRSFRTGETVQLTVRPWSRRVMSVGPAPVPFPVAPVVPAAVPVPAPPSGVAIPAAQLPEAQLPAAQLPAAQQPALLGAPELSAWFGVPLHAGQSLPVGPATAAWSYRIEPGPPGEGASRDGAGHGVVLVSVGRGAADGMALERARRGTPVPGVGEEAYLTDQGAGVARWGSAVVQVTVPPPLGVDREALVTALQAAVVQVAKLRLG